MDRARTAPPLHAEKPNGMTDDYRFFFLFEKNWTSNQEGGTRVVRGGLSTIHFLPHVAGSAADRSTFFLLNGVVRDGTRALFTQSRAVRTPIFNQRSRTSNDQEGAPPRVVRGGLPTIHFLPNVAGSAANRATFCLLNGVAIVAGDGPRAHCTSTPRGKAERNDG